MESIRVTMSARETPFRNGDVEAVAISVLAANGLSRSIAVVLAMRLSRCGAPMARSSASRWAYTGGPLILFIESF
jgi:hypothetical protein